MVSFESLSDFPLFYVSFPADFNEESCPSYRATIFISSRELERCNVKSFSIVFGENALSSGFIGCCCTFIYCIGMMHNDACIIACFQQNNLYSIHTEKYQSKIRALETLASGTTKEIEVL